MFRQNSSILFRTSSLLFSAKQNIPISNLHPPKTGIPDNMAHVELSGTPNLDWLANLPKFTELLDSATRFPDANHFWQNTPTATALEAVASTQPYFEILKTISEHGFFFLIPRAILAKDAPLPHVAYEDIMNALMTCSMQRPPEEQFQLLGSVLRLLLCTAAHHILHDKEYFLAVETWFRRHVERQQSLGSEAWSAWVMCCVAADKCESAIMFLKHMEESKIEFDPVIFNFMLHPSEIMMNEKGVPDRVFSQHVTKGFIAQQRLLTAMLAEDGVVATGIHAMFVYYAITRQTVQQWETIRIAVEQRQKLSERTIKMILNVFAHEKGQKCGPLTMKALVKMFAARKDMLNTCFILATARQREVSRAMAKIKKQQLRNHGKSIASSITAEENLELVLHSVPIMRFPKHEENFILECFAPVQEDRRTFKEREFDNHFPLLQKLISGERKKFSESEEKLLVSRKSDSVVIQQNQAEDDLDLNLVTDLILRQSANALQQQQQENAKSLASLTTINNSRQLPKKFISREQMETLQKEFTNPTSSETRNAESMIHFSQEFEKEKQREMFYEMKRATAWMDGDGDGEK